MIDIDLYRSRIGSYSKFGCSRCKKEKKLMGTLLDNTLPGNVFCKTVCVLLYLYIICIIMALTIDVANTSHHVNTKSKNYFELTFLSNFNNTILGGRMNIGFLILLGHILKLYLCRKVNGKNFFH